MPQLLRISLLLAIAALPSFALAPFNISCQKGAQTVTTSSIPSTTKVQQSYAGATVTVFIHGGAVGVVSTSGTAVTWVSGTQFNANSDWNGIAITINAVPYTISTVTDTTHLTLSSSAGTQTSVAYGIATAKAPIFSDYAGNTPQANPLTCSATAGFLVYSPNSIVDETFSGTGIAVPFTLSAAPGVDPLSTTTGLVTYNASIGTAAQQCTAAASANQTLIVPQIMAALTTQAMTCSMAFLKGGMIQPASGQTVTINPNFTCGDYQQCFDVSAASSHIAFSSPPVKLNPNWWGADATGTGDSTAALVATVAAAQVASIPVRIPAGQYKHSGLTIANGVDMQGETTFGAVLLYSGSGTAITATGFSGIFGNMAIRSTTGHAGAAVGLDMRFATELQMPNLYFGGAPTSGFATCLRARSSAAVIDSPHFSWCDTGFLADLDAAANIGIVIHNAVFFQSSNAGVQIADAGQFEVNDSTCEAVQDCILLDNTNGPVVATGPTRIINNHGLMLTTSNGQTFTAPQFLHVKTATPANSVAISGFVLDGNDAVCYGGAYCNTLTKTSSPGGGFWGLFFSNNVWTNLMTAAVNGDLASVNAVSTNDTFPGGAGPVEFAGSMTGTVNTLGTNGAIATQLYSGGVYKSLLASPVAHTVAPSVAVPVSDCGTSPAFVAGSNDRGGSVQVGTGVITSCKVTFGTAFAAQPALTVGLAFNATTTATITGFPTAAGFFTITGTNMQGSTFSWVVSDASN